MRARDQTKSANREEAVEPLSVPEFSVVFSNTQELVAHKRLRRCSSCSLTETKSKRERQDIIINAKRDKRK